MRRAFAILVPTLLVAVPLALAACSRQESAPPKPYAPAPAPPPPPKPAVAPAPVAPPQPAPFSVTSISVGNAIGADKRVTSSGTSFAPADTIYASVASDGAAPSVTLTARWIYGTDQIITESTQTIAPTGPTVSEFHVSKPDGWPAGTYKVEVVANGAPAGSQTFEVK